MASAKASDVPSQSHPAVHTHPRRLRHHRPSRHTCQGSWMVGRGAPLHEGEVQQNLSRRAREGSRGVSVVVVGGVGLWRRARRSRGGGVRRSRGVSVGCVCVGSACGAVHDALERPAAAAGDDGPPGVPAGCIARSGIRD